jgi:transcriptional regulator with XRE-family HTH domain
MDSTRARLILATNLKARRHQSGLSQEDLALEAGLHRTFVAHVERGVRNLSIDNIEKLANALGVESYMLLVPSDGIALLEARKAG